MRAYKEIRRMDSTLHDCVSLWQTNGTPVDITRVVAEVTRRICLGNIEYHYRRLFRRRQGHHARGFHRGSHPDGTTG